MLHALPDALLCHFPATPTKKSCDDNKVKMTRKPGKKQKENPVGYTGLGRR